MAMRITTKMMQNTSLRNLNINKQRQEMLTNQMATGKKITRPSDDPVTAIRALKLNASLDKIDQYYERNAQDAQSWLDLTDKAIATVADILGGENNMRYLLVQAKNSYNETTDMNALVEQLLNLAEEFYSVGNADSAGRSLFTGYRTDLPLTFTQDDPTNYKIIEQLTNLDMDKMTYVGTGCLKELNEGNFNVKIDPDDPNSEYKMNTTEYDVTTNEIYRFRLAYDNTRVAESVYTDKDADGKVIDVPAGYPNNIVYAKDENGNDKLDAKGDKIPVYKYEPEVILQFRDSTTGEDVKYRVNPYSDTTGEPVDSPAAKPIKVFSSGTEEAYMYAVNNKDAVVYIASTGEVLLGSDVKDQVSKLTHDTEVRITYERDNWKKNDLMPMHYFYAECKHETQDRQLYYNENFLDPETNNRQVIEYDIGNNQTIRVNTTADELFSPGVGRDVEELKRMVDEHSTLKANIKVIQELIDSDKYEGDDLKQLELQKAALEKAETYAKDKMLARMDDLIKVFDGYIADVSTATTSCGARGSRLTLIQNRLKTQQTNYKELVSENEDADYAELTVQLASIKQTYDAALSSISYVMQTSLLDYIR